MFREPWVAQAANAAMFSLLAELVGRLVDRLIARRMPPAPAASPIAPPAPAPVPAPASAVPVLLTFDLQNNLERITATPPVTRARWGLSEERLDYADAPMLTLFCALDWCHPEVVVNTARGGHGIEWSCPSGRVAREQLRMLSAMPGLSKMEIVAETTRLGQAPMIGVLGDPAFWQALRALDA